MEWENSKNYKKEVCLSETQIGIIQIAIFKIGADDGRSWWLSCRQLVIERRQLKSPVLEEAQCQAVAAIQSILREYVDICASPPK